MYAINFITGKTLNIFLFKYDLLLRFFFPWYAIITMQNHVGYSKISRTLSRPKPNVFGNSPQNPLFERFR